MTIGEYTEDISFRKQTRTDVLEDTGLLHIFFSRKKLIDLGKDSTVISGFQYSTLVTD